MNNKSVLLTVFAFFLIIVLIFGCSSNKKSLKTAPIVETPDIDKCETELCNKDVEVICQDNNCEQEPLNYYLLLQTEVVQCLENYFSFDASRIAYKISSTERAECEQEGGCCCTTGGSTDWSGISQSNFYGNIPFRERETQKSEDIIAEEHEATHFFLYYMLKGHPSWFSEAIAIETNERVNCDVSAMDLEGSAKEFAKKGDTYLRETQPDLISSGGVVMSDGTTLDNDYFSRLKQGYVFLNENEMRDSHIIGTLWIISLKEDYSCGEQCVLRIVKELQEYASSQCLPGTYCGDNPLQFPDIISNEVIKEKTDLVVGENTEELFKLLGLV